MNLTITPDAVYNHVGVITPMKICHTNPITKSFLYVNPHPPIRSFIMKVLSGMVSSLIVEDTMEEDVPEELTNIDQDIVFIVSLIGD